MFRHLFRHFGCPARCQAPNLDVVDCPGLVRRGGQGPAGERGGPDGAAGEAEIRIFPGFAGEIPRKSLEKSLDISGKSLENLWTSLENRHGNESVGGVWDLDVHPRYPQGTGNWPVYVYVWDVEWLVTSMSCNSLHTTVHSLLWRNPILDCWWRCVDVYGMILRIAVKFSS